MSGTRTMILDQMRWSHTETRRVLSAYAEGRLRWPTRWRVSRHLARCEPCRSLYESLLETLASLRRLGQADVEGRAQLTADVLERREGAARERGSQSLGS
jgi:anti-sigma factor RsiW